MDEEDVRIEMLFEKINSHLDKSSDCWIWTGYVDSYGYGKVYKDLYASDIARVLVNRVMYYFKVGDIPDGMVVTPICGNRLCCNPKHLSLASRSDISANGKKTHCIRGHELPEPKQVGIRFIRVCPECNRIRQAEYRKSKAEVLPFA